MQVQAGSNPYSYINTSYKEDLEKEGNLLLKNVKVEGTVKSFNGDIDAENSDLQKVEAKNEIYLDACSATFVNSSENEVTWRKWKGEQKAEERPTIIAKESIRIRWIHADKIESLKGKVSVIEGSVNSLSAESNIRLDQTKVEKIFINKGDLTIKKSEVGAVQINQCQEISVSHSTINSMELIVTDQKTLEISLVKSCIKDSLLIKRVASCGKRFILKKIKNELIADIIAPRFKSRPGDPLPKTLKFAAKISDKPELRVNDIVFKKNEKGQYIHVKQPESSDLEEITLEDLIKELDLKKMQASNVTINDYVPAAGGNFCITPNKITCLTPPPGYKIVEEYSQASQNLSPVRLEIMNGEIKGNIEFQGCEGEVELIDAKLSGEVINGKVIDD